MYISEVKAFHHFLKTSRCTRWMLSGVVLVNCLPESYASSIVFFFRRRNIRTNHKHIFYSLLLTPILLASILYAFPLTFSIIYSKILCLCVPTLHLMLRVILTLFDWSQRVSSHVSQCFPIPRCLNIWSFTEFFRLTVYNILKLFKLIILLLNNLI